MCFGGSRLVSISAMFRPHDKFNLVHCIIRREFGGIPNVLYSIDTIAITKRLQDPLPLEVHDKSSTFCRSIHILCGKFHSLSEKDHFYYFQKVLPLEVYDNSCTFTTLLVNHGGLYVP